MKFKAFRIHEEKGRVRSGFEQLALEELTPGEVLIRAVYSNVNYKDALAATGKGKIVRRFPLVGGIDVAGYVEQSTDSRYQKGAEVAVCGCGLSETLDGGYAEYVRVPAECVLPLPEGLSLFEAMALGTAGLTAALAIDKLERNDQRPALGPVIVTGATGGVGSLAIDLLAGLGYRVTALTGKAEQTEYLKALGASDILLRQDLELGERPLERALWGGAVDTVGGETLAWLTRTIKPLGNIAVIGLVGSAELHTTVMPFILRGINLLGISSVMCPIPIKRKVWKRLGSDLRPRHLGEIVHRVIEFSDLPAVFDDFISGQTVGRTVVKIS